MAIRNQPFKSVFGRIRYAFTAAVVFSAVVALPAALCAVMLLPSTRIAPQLAATILFSIPAVLFPLCYIYASALHAWMPIERTKAMTRHPKTPA